jgi:GNAT superfamily N-acetyltransferase
MVIAQNERMVAINAALQVDLTGQVCADSVGPRFYSGVGGQVDFIRGAAASKGGRSIIALPSTAKGGTISRIAPVLSAGAGVVTTRADVDFVVTEYGIASLKGKTIRERAVALIQIAHPSFREGLLKSAQRLGYLEAGHIIPVQAKPYRADLETSAEFKGAEVFFRPIKPSDERRLKDLFYSQSAETTYRRFGIPLKRLSEKQFQELVAIDYRGSMAIGGFVREGARQRLIAVGRYSANPGGRTAEAAFTVHDDYQGRGIGTYLLDYLAWVAREDGLEGFTALVMTMNAPMRRVFESRFRRIEVHSEDGYELMTMLFRDWTGSGSPAAVC